MDRESSQTRKKGGQHTNAREGDGHANYIQYLLQLCGRIRKSNRVITVGFRGAAAMHE